MISNSVTIGLAVISLVCVYLLWENFKMTSKLRYLESSIHETVQTVQSLVNNSICLPPRHPESINAKPETVPQQSTQPPQYQPSRQQQQQQQPQQISPPSKSTTEPPANNIFGNLIGSLFKNNPLINMMNLDNIGEEHIEGEDDDMEDGDMEDGDMEDGEYDEDEEGIEPLEMSDELKNQINSLEFTEGETGELEEVKEETKEVDDEIEELKLDDVETIEPVESKETFEIEDTLNQDAQETKEEHVEKEVDEVEEIKNETTEETDDVEKRDNSYEETPELLNHMTVKQLQDIAEKYKLGKRGTKEQLLTKIKRNLHEKN
jgi:hypothetical protein